MFKVRGSNRLNGSIKVQGAKNSVLVILAASVLNIGKTVIHNCPQISDVDNTLKILQSLGCVVLRDKSSIIIDSTDITGYAVNKPLMSKMRSSVLFLGALLSRLSTAVICTPGGCNLGPRPIDLHISSLKKIGAEIIEKGDTVTATAIDGIVGNIVELEYASVGVTENLILASAVSRGTTVIKNAAREPEIGDLISFLNSAGADISGKGTSEITVRGVKRLFDTEFTVMPDRIAAVTYLTAGAITGGKIKIDGVNFGDIKAVTDVLALSGCEIKRAGNSVLLDGQKDLKPIEKIAADPYPGFPTDAGPVIMPYLAVLPGISVLKENVFPERFAYVNELKKFGADITVMENTAIINGNRRLKSANVSCTDLRGGAALLLAALAADGESEIKNTYYITRGYEHIVENLVNLGAFIKEI